MKNKILFQENQKEKKGRHIDYRIRQFIFLFGVFCIIFVFFILMTPRFDLFFIIFYIILLLFLIILYDNLIRKRSQYSCTVYNIGFVYPIKLPSTEKNNLLLFDNVEDIAFAQYGLVSEIRLIGGKIETLRGDECLLGYVKIIHEICSRLKKTDIPNLKLIQEYGELIRNNSNKDTLNQVFNEITKENKRFQSLPDEWGN